jgi:epoxyqueuosine reductase
LEWDENRFGVGFHPSTRPTWLEGLGVMNVPVPSDDPSEYWEPDRSYARGILSLRHAGHLAGLGILGKNTLLINQKFGNMIQLGALLLSEELEGDPIALAIGYAK